MFKYLILICIVNSSMSARSPLIDMRYDSMVEQEASKDGVLFELPPMKPFDPEEWKKQQSKPMPEPKKGQTPMTDEQRQAISDVLFRLSSLLKGQKLQISAQERKVIFGVSGQAYEGVKMFTNMRGALRKNGAEIVHDWA